jgi:hypothetical protein
MTTETITEDDLIKDSLAVAAHAAGRVYHSVYLRDTTPVKTPTDARAPPQQV